MSWKTEFSLGSFAFNFSITALVDDFASFPSSKDNRHISVALSFMASNAFLCFLPNCIEFKEGHFSASNRKGNFTLLL